MATRRRPRRRKSPRRQQEPTAPVPRRQPSELETKARSAVGRLLDVMEKDPERVVRGAEQLINGIEKISDFVRENPEGAKRAARNTAMSVMAKLAKKKLGG